MDVCELLLARATSRSCSYLGSLTYTTWMMVDVEDGTVFFFNSSNLAKAAKVLWEGMVRLIKRASRSQVVTLHPATVATEANLRPYAKVVPVWGRRGVDEAHEKAIMKIFGLTSQAVTFAEPSRTDFNEHHAATA